MNIGKRTDQERSDRIHRARFYFYKFGTGLGLMILGITSLPLRITANGIASAGQVKTETLPLLAALGVGIAVAVGAVIAFLQMTAKGRETSEASQPSASLEKNEGELVEEWEEEASELNTEYDEEHYLTDYTIPLTRHLAYPELAEPASGDEPRVCGLEGEHAGLSYRLMNRSLAFGRDPAQCSVLFSYDLSLISRVHCILSYKEDSRTFLLEDRGSSNGTYLQDGVRLEPGRVYELRAGQRFSLSGTDHSYEVREL